MKNKRILAIISGIAILAFGILLGSLPASASADGQDKWSKASPYMINELREAQANGLIPEILGGNDFTQPMTRAEFAHLIVLMLKHTQE